MKHTSRRLTVSMALLLLVAGGGSALAADPEFGMIGLANGQTLRLNVIAFPPDPCVAQIGFLTRNGAQTQPDPGKTVDLAPGMSDFVDLDSASLNITLGQRIELQPIVRLLASTVPDTVSACTATVELFTTKSADTAVTVSQPQRAVPNVAPLFGLVGIGVGQVLRLNVNAWPPDPCVAQIGFLGANGAPQPLPDKTVDLAPGTGTFVDLGAGLLGLTPGERAELLPVVMMLPGPNGASTCQADVELYIRRTGRTRIALNPQPLPP